MYRQILVLILVVVSFAVFFNSLSNGFVYDDELLITGQKEYLSDLKNVLYSTVSMVFQDKTVSALYRPGLMLTHFMDFQLWKGRAFGFHLTNLLLHLICVVLTFYSILKIFHDEIIAFFAGLIFAVHPVQSEAVAWVSGRNDPLLLIFILLAFIFYVRLTGKRSAGDAFGLIISFAAALLVKETAVIFPLAFIAYDLLIRRCRVREWLKNENLRPYFYLLGATIVYFVWRLYVFRGGAFSGIQNQPLSLSQLGLIPLVYGFYLKVLVWPGSFSIIPYIKMLMSPAEYLLRSVPFILLAVSLFFLPRRMPAAAFGLLWGVIALLPVCGLLTVPVLVMEHRLYSAMFGFALALAWVGREIYKWAEKKKAHLLIMLIYAAIFLTMGWLTVERNGYFKDPLTLWRASVRQNPDNEQIRGNLGASLVDKGDLKEGEKELLLAAQLGPNNPINHYNLGYLYLITKREEQGIIKMRKAVELDPKYLKAHYNLGIYALNHGNRKEAVKEMETILRLNPHFEPARMMLEKLKTR
jgi:hypothetical protein